MVNDYFRIWFKCFELALILMVGSIWGMHDELPASPFLELMNFERI
ncbi:hypothetical protein Msub_10558 [Marinobacter subterrani]|uniref:Uncharacterized protein n=1 Tax=Marinobacter subterrani TaxID=1658765 RepID=A0A0J7LZR1_9GAMM|nr:hypothetical protein Msub_10558 [Marinobacter subterrani]